MYWLKFRFLKLFFIETVRNFLSCAFHPEVSNMHFLFFFKNLIVMLRLAQSNTMTYLQTHFSCFLCLPETTTSAFCWIRPSAMQVNDPASAGFTLLITRLLCFTADLRPRSVWPDAEKIYLINNKTTILCSRYCLKCVSTFPREFPIGNNNFRFTKPFQSLREGLTR